MNLFELTKRLEKSIRKNSPQILTVLSVAGVGSTAYLSARAGYQTAQKLEAEEPWGGDRENKQRLLKERTKKVWTLYIPPAISGVLTVSCVVGSSKVSASRTAAAVAAYSVTEATFHEYREKVVEEIGKQKEQKVRDSIVEDKIVSNPPGAIVVGSGHVMCCELLTGRYFMSDMETLRRAVNDVNARINSERYVTLDEFYYIIGLDTTTHSGNVGWDSDRLLELEFSTVLANESEPCLAFDYNYTKPL